MGISAGNLAELLADQFAARPLALQAPPTEAAARSILSSYHHADSADAEKERLLECFNTIWGTGALPESWLVAVVTPILKSRKPAIALSSYGPVPLIFAACKAVERVALARLEWIAAQLPYFPEQQTGFRCQRCTADFISDESAGVTLEDAKATGDVAMLVLLDACLDRLGLNGCLGGFISAFLTGRTFRVREPRDITTGVPQGSVLSPSLFNMDLAGLPASSGGPTRRGTLVPGAEEVHAIHSVLATMGTRCSLTVSTANTEAMLVHPLASARRHAKQLKIASRALTWKQMYFPEQQTGFRRQRCTADSISDVVATLEDAKATGDVAMLVFLDVKSAFDGLPHAVIEACLDRLGLSGCLRRFIFRIPDQQNLPGARWTGTQRAQGYHDWRPTGIVLSPFLFNMALAGLPASLPAVPRFPVRCSIYADDVALWTRGAEEVHAIHSVLATTGTRCVTAFLGSICLTVSTAKTEAMLIHPVASARRYSKQLNAGRALPWRQVVTYLGLAMTTGSRGFLQQGAVSKLQQHGPVKSFSEVHRHEDARMTVSSTDRLSTQYTFLHKQETVMGAKVWSKPCLCWMEATLCF
ncbi:hypothetical protein HPB49_001080 [Dermacentor silvarum]|uniref:Uncharacterized protein n=1 Tax=Dermacentor silvarum TaxID=543639 RepID=A0ACB8CJ22_DERSI|nr:hypothetical protein HPB49_001080 [Dermacentor silvarum]